MPELIAALRDAAATVRTQIPKGELTRQSVERLLEAAEAVCAETAKLPPPAPAARRAPGGGAGGRVPSLSVRRQETRAKWAQIARQNEQTAHQDAAE